MRTRIIRIGNSHGIRIPKSFLQRSKLTEEVEIEAFDSYIVIRSAYRPRQGWAKAFRAIADRVEYEPVDELDQGVNGFVSS